MWNSTFLTQRNPGNASRGFAGLTFFATLIAVVGASAGTLRLGTPTINNNQYTFPVVLQGDAEGVAALDFRLAYDPAVFNPVSAQSGTTALQAQKQVSSNIAAPGEFVVVLMGFNQNTVGAGEVVEVVLEKIGEPSGGATTLRIAEPTLATNVGIEVDSRGIGRTLRFETDEVKDSEAETESDTTPESPDSSKGNTPEANSEPGSETVYPSGPLFVARAEQPSVAGDGDTTGANQSGRGETGAPSDSGNAAPPTSQPGNGDGATGFTTGMAISETSQSEKVTRLTGSDAAKNAPAAPMDAEISASQPLDSKALNDTNQEKLVSDEKKSRHGVPKYATLLLLAVSIPVGLLAILRIAGK